MGSPKYLRQMLLSVGLDVPDNARWLGSLRQLANQRGDTAHGWRAKKIPSPEGVTAWVRDCMEMCASIREDANSALYQPAFGEEDRNYVL